MGVRRSSPRAGDYEHALEMLATLSRDLEVLIAAQKTDHRVPVRTLRKIERDCIAAAIALGQMRNRSQRNSP